MARKKNTRKKKLSKKSKCDFLCGRMATMRIGRLNMCDECDECADGKNDGCAVEESKAPAKMPRRRLYSPEDLADARRFLSNMRQRAVLDEDEEEFMTSAADRLYDVKFVGRFAQRIDHAIATYHAHIDKSKRLAAAAMIGTAKRVHDSKPGHNA